MSKFFIGENLDHNFFIGKEKGKIVFIDALNRIYKQSIGLISKNVNLDNNNLKSYNESNLHIASIFNFTIQLLKYGILPVYIFDGKCPEEKKQIVMKRKNDKQIYKEICSNIEDKTSPEFVKNYKKSFSLTKKQIDECKHVLDLMGLKYVVALEEADQQCALLANFYKKDSIGVITDDWDILMHGSPNILKDFNFKNINATMKIEKEIVLQKCLFKANNIRKKNNLAELDIFTHENFLNFCILMGTDYAINDKLLKIDNFSHDKLFEYYCISNFDINNLAQKLYTENKISSIEDFLFSFSEIKKLYDNPKFINPENITLTPDKINVDELINFLHNKGINKTFIENEIKNINMNYFSLKKIVEFLNDPRSFSNLKSYQYKHYCDQYKRIHNCNCTKIYN
jgi:flap endonuclease-1